MPENDLVFVDDEYRLAGWLVGMSDEAVAAYIKKYHLRIWTYMHFCKHWEMEGRLDNG